MKDERGATLVELLVGLSIGVLLLFAVLDTEILSWRLQVQDEDRFLKQSHASLVADRFVKDVRQATAVTLVDGAAHIQLTLPSGLVTYHLDLSRGEVLRQSAEGSQVAGREIGALAFFRESDGRTLRVEIRSRLRDGSEYQVITRAAPRR